MSHKITTTGATLTVGETDAVPDHMRGRVLEVSDVRVEPKYRRKGYGSAIMARACADADIARHVLILQPWPEVEGMIEAQLVAWYERFGFVMIQDSPPLMARAPQQTRIMH